MRGILFLNQILQRDIGSKTSKRLKQNIRKEDYILVYCSIFEEDSI